MDKVRKALEHFSEIVEVILAVVVAVLIVMDFIGLLPRVAEFWSAKGNAEEFAAMLSSVLSIVVGTEFIKMLLKPSLSNVTEVLIFLIARHVILAEGTPVDYLISVMSIAILYVLEYALEKHRIESNRAEIASKFFTKLSRRGESETADGNDKGEE